jgi:hypothetical protein
LFALGTFQILQIAGMLGFTSMIKIIQAAAIFTALFFPKAQGIPRPEVPDNIKVITADEVILQVHATGSQIYVCQPGTDQKFAWILKAPDAELFDAQGKNIGHHGAGPSWKLKDGSEVTGKLLAKHDAPDATAIPWLLVAVAEHVGSGALASVTFIQRIHTKDGQPPAASTCNDSKRGTESTSPYSADYYFYAPKH